jgi:hypothetical protein
MPSFRIPPRRRDTLISLRAASRRAQRATFSSRVTVMFRKREFITGI